MTNSELLIGKTIQSIIEGKIDRWDEGWIVYSSDGDMFLIRGGSSSSRGILSCEQITAIPESFRPDE